MSLSDKDLELASKYIFTESDFKDWLSGKKENVQVMMFTHEALETFLAERDTQQADKVRELEAKILDLPRYSFLSPKEGGVRRCGDKSGAWIEHYEVIKLLEAMKGE